MDTFNKDQETSCQLGLMGVTGLLGAQWLRWRQCLFSEGQPRPHAAFVMSAGGQARRGQPECWLPAPVAPPGRSEVGPWAEGGPRSRGISLLPKARAKSRLPCLCPLPRLLGIHPAARAGRGRRQGVTQALPEGKVGLGMGFPGSFPNLPDRQGPGRPAGSSLRNRKMSVDGKVR